MVLISLYNFFIIFIYHTTDVQTKGPSSRTTASLGAPHDDTTSSPTSTSTCTHSVQAGEGKTNRQHFGDTLTTPVALSSAFWFKDTDQLVDFCEDRHKSFEYGRYGNPTTSVAEDKLSALEGAEECLFSASGMSTCTTMMLALVPKVWVTSYFQFLLSLSLSLSLFLSLIYLFSTNLYNFVSYDMDFIYFLIYCLFIHLFHLLSVCLFQFFLLFLFSCEPYLFSMFH